VWRAAEATQELIPIVIVPKQPRQRGLLRGDSLRVWGLLTCSGDTGKEVGKRRLRGRGREMCPHSPAGALWLALLQGLLSLSFLPGIG
jgi:hypothetical protein